MNNKRNTALDVAWNAAWDATRDAERNAARAAVRDVVWNAERDAAWDAARGSTLVYSLGGMKNVIETVAEMSTVEARLYLQSCFEGKPTSQFVALPIAGGLLENNPQSGDWVHFDAGNARQKKAAVIDDRMPELLPLSEQEHLAISLAVDAEVISEEENIVTFEVARRAAEAAAHLIAQQRGWEEYEVDGNPRKQVYRVSAR